MAPVNDETTGPLREEATEAVEGIDVTIADETFRILVEWIGLDKDSSADRETIDREALRLQGLTEAAAQPLERQASESETVMNITDASRSTESTRDERDALRAQLNSLYDGYVDRWGPINRFSFTEPAPLTEKKIAERLDKAIERWRIKIGKAEAREEGLLADQARPYTGQVPEDILEEMQEKAATEPVPQKNQSHLKGAIAGDRPQPPTHSCRCWRPCAIPSSASSSIDGLPPSH